MFIKDDYVQVLLYDAVLPNDRNREGLKVGDVETIDYGNDKLRPYYLNKMLIFRFAVLLLF